MAVSKKQISHRINHILATRFRIVSFTVVAIVVLLGGFFFLYPKFSEIRTVGIFDQQRTQNQLELKQKIVSETRDLTKMYDQLNLDDVEKLDAVLPKEQDIPDLFVQVEAIATASNLRLENVGFAEVGATKTVTTPVATEEDTGVTATNKSTNTSTNTATVPAPRLDTRTLKQINVTFTVSGGGGYEDLKTFLTNVESSIRLFDIQSLTYSPTDQAEQYLINAVTYYLQ